MPHPRGTWKDCLVMPAPSRDRPVIPCQEWDALVRWLEGLDLTTLPATVRTGAAVEVETRRHAQWLQAAISRAQTGQVRVGLWLAMERLYEALEVNRE